MPGLREAGLTRSVPRHATDRNLRAEFQLVAPPNVRLARRAARMGCAAASRPARGGRLRAFPASPNRPDNADATPHPRSAWSPDRLRVFSKVLKQVSSAASPERTLDLDVLRWLGGTKPMLGITVKDAASERHVISGF